MKRNIRKKQSGITLIALVVTIVVLLILAGVSIAMLTGDNGIITQAQKSKEETRGGSVEEERDLWISTIKMNEQSNTSESKTLDELLEELKRKNLLTDDEVAKIKKDGIVTIGNHVIDFSLQDKIDYSKLNLGLYQSDTTTIIKTWDELKNNGDIVVDGTDLTRVDRSLEGDLVISSEIVNIGGETIGISEKRYNLFGSPCGGMLGTITKVYIPSSVEKIYSSAFEGWYKINQVIIENGLKEIGSSAFANCNALEKINIPDSVVSIGENAFGETFWSVDMDRFYNLTTLYLPSSVINIEGRLCDFYRRMA